MGDLEYQLLKDWQELYKSLVPDSKADIIIYLKITPENAYERIRRRSRDGELNISLEYLKGLDETHQKWLFKDTRTAKDCKILILDANLDQDKIKLEYERVLQEVEAITTKSNF